MITIKDIKTDKARVYTCEPARLKELCFANIECLLRIALADSDAHIRELGGEQMLLTLMNDYEKFARKMKQWEQDEKRR